MQDAAAASSKPTPDELRSLLIDMVEDGRAIPPERQLVHELGVSRSRLRRVLADLRDSGRIPPAQVGRRALQRATPQIDGLVRVANPIDVIEMRVMLEPQFARLAAIRASAVEIARIQRAAESGPDTDYGKADLAFHQEVARASRNSLASEIYDMLRHVGTDVRVRMAQPSPPCEKRRAARDAEHRAVAAAIAARDPDGAETAMRAHLAEVQRLIHRRLSPDLPV